MTTGGKGIARGPLPWLGWAAPLQVCLLLALVVWIGALSLSWPLEGDATVFHFLAVQHGLGALPYRDAADMNLPLIYWIHDALVAIAGPGDEAFRVFDLLSTLLAGGLAAAFVWPAGRVSAVLAGLSLAFSHLSFGPTDAGQRDFLLLIPALAAAICGVAASEAETGRTRVPLLLVAGLAVAMAALFKPTAVLLGLLVFVADGRVRLTTMLWTGLGFAIGMAAPVGVLAATHALTPFLQGMAQYLPAYGPIDRQSKRILILLIGGTLVKFSGFVLSGALSARSSADGRARVAIFMVIFGVVHVFAQGKGYFYHFHPLILGLILWGAVGLARLGPRAAAVCVALMAVYVGEQGAQTLRRAYAFLPVGRSMQARQLALETALTSRLPQGSRVEALDAEAGGTLAMARAHLRQATPDIYWFFFSPEMPARRRVLLQTLQAAPPAGVLVTINRGNLSPVENWPDMDQFLAGKYNLVEDHPVGTITHPWENGVAGWKLYIKK